MAKQNVNYWQLAHDELNDEKKKAAKEEIKQACEWSEDTFYRKKKTPQALKQWEKTVVAGAYGYDVDEMFLQHSKKQKAA